MGIRLFPVVDTTGDHMKTEIVKLAKNCAGDNENVYINTDKSCIEIGGMKNPYTFGLFIHHLEERNIGHSIAEKGDGWVAYIQL
jgi:hypothetical protein